MHLKKYILFWFDWLVFFSSSFSLVYLTETIIDKNCLWIKAVLEVSNFGNLACFFLKKKKKPLLTKQSRLIRLNKKCLHWLRSQWKKNHDCCITCIRSIDLPTIFILNHQLQCYIWFHLRLYGYVDDEESSKLKRKILMAADEKILYPPTREKKIRAYHLEVNGCSRRSDWCYQVELLRQCSHPVSGNN